MKYQIEFVDSEGDTVSKPDRVEIDGIYKEVETKEHIYESKDFEIKPKAVLQNGEAVLIEVKEYKLPYKHWFSNALEWTQIDENHWSKKYTVTRWFVDLGTFDDLREFLDKHDVSLKFSGDIGTIRYDLYG